ncbi:MAG TPA: mycofactocin system FadH/OYE family oxidoreductase 1 [Ilumatobacteraceae bacterium]|nr:mycofactocin system FadH/OYE family oxidoreductase 1 [Ilumatobacteraceae bacterium]
MDLLSPLRLGPSDASNRLMFGPHVTNLGDDDRRFTPRHTAYYRRRAAGGCGVIVTEGASVHGSDWPYERAPLAERCAPGWKEIAGACHEHGSLVIASLDHAGGQGSSAYSQLPLWAPSRVPEVNTRETPKWMEASDIAAVVAGFAAAAELAVGAGCDGVEINAGQHSLVRQFLSGLTNHRTDAWGNDRLLFAREVIASVRTHTPLLGLRLCCDELAPWAGITPEMAPPIAAALAEAGVDYIVVSRGSIYSAEKTRPDFHEPTGCNIEVCRAVKAATPDTPIFLQGSVVEWGQAEWAIGNGVCDGVEMTRAQIADPDLVRKLRSDASVTIRPCIRCNQKCQVRDARNPIVSCVGEPSAGRETEDPDWYAPTTAPRRAVVLGGGVAGLEAARVAATRGHRVVLVERAEHLGGMAAIAGPGAPLAAWLEAECRRLAVEIQTGTTAIPEGDVTIQCTGSQPGLREYEVGDASMVIDVADVRRGAQLPDGRIAVFDPIGGPIAVALAEELGARAMLITQDHIAGNELSITGDLAPANVRLAQRGVTIERRTLLRAVRRGEIEVEDRFTGQRRTITCAALVDCGFRLPDSPLARADLQAGDCVAPRTIYEAVLEGRRAALAVDAVR